MRGSTIFLMNDFHNQFTLKHAQKHNSESKNSQPNGFFNFLQCHQLEDQVL